jgi:hypothetical protein
VRTNAEQVAEDHLPDRRQHGEQDADPQRLQGRRVGEEGGEVLQPHELEPSQRVALEEREAQRPGDGPELEQHVQQKGRREEDDDRLAISEDAVHVIQLS